MNCSFRVLELERSVVHGAGATTTGSTSMTWCSKRGSGETPMRILCSPGSVSRLASTVTASSAASARSTGGRIREPNAVWVTPRRPVEQLLAQALFQLGDPVGQCGLGDPVSPRGGAERLRPLPREYDRARASTDELWKDLTPDEVAWRPHENSSGIGWHLGHQAAVAHFMIRNLTAAEPSPDPALDGLMDSANPERFRGALPTIRRLTESLLRRLRHGSYLPRSAIWKLDACWPAGSRPTASRNFSSPLPGPPDRLRRWVARCSRWISGAQKPSGPGPGLLRRSPTSRSGPRPPG